MNRKDFVRFLQALSDAYVDEGRGWENSDLRSYLRGLIRSAIQVEQDLKEEGSVLDPDTASWELFREILYNACQKELTMDQLRRYRPEIDGSSGV